MRHVICPVILVLTTIILVLFPMSIYQFTRGNCNYKTYALVDTRNTQNCTVSYTFWAFGEQYNVTRARIPCHLINETIIPICYGRNPERNTTFNNDTYISMNSIQAMFIVSTTLLNIILIIFIILSCNHIKKTSSPNDVV